MEAFIADLDVLISSELKHYEQIQHLLGIEDSDGHEGTWLQTSVNSVTIASSDIEKATGRLPVEFPERFEAASALLSTTERGQLYDYVVLKHKATTAATSGLPDTTLNAALIDSGQRPSEGRRAAGEQKCDVAGDKRKRRKAVYVAKRPYLEVLRDVIERETERLAASGCDEAAAGERQASPASSEVAARSASAVRHDRQRVSQQKHKAHKHKRSDRTRPNSDSPR